MILYVNGDGHSAAAFAAVNYATSEEDFDRWWAGTAPHPENARVSYCYTLSSVLKARPVLEAKINQTNQEIVDATKKFLSSNPVKEQTIVIIGFPELDADLYKEFGDYLKSQNIKHILYPTKDYVDWVTARGFIPNEYGYFGETAQKAWAGNLVKPLTKLV